MAKAYVMPYEYNKEIQDTEVDKMTPTEGIESITSSASSERDSLSSQQNS